MLSNVACILAVMSYFESSRLYSRSEYESYKDDRSAPQSLYQDEDGVLMIATKRWFTDFEATSFPMRFTQCARYSEPLGIWVVNAALLNNDMQPTKNRFNLHLLPCGMLDTNSSFVTANRNYAEGYIRGYDDGLSGGFFSLLSAVGAHPSALNL